MHQLTQRELLYLEDYLKNEQLSSKTMDYFADQCSDQSIKQLCHDAAQSHRQNYQTMVKNINSGSFQ